MITYAEARMISEKEVSNIQQALGFDVEINHQLDKEVNLGFIFFYNSSEFWRDDSSRLALAGNGPLLVLKDSGELINLPTCMPLEEGLEEVRREREKRGRFVISVDVLIESAVGAEEKFDSMWDVEPYFEKVMECIQNDVEAARRAEVIFINLIEGKRDCVLLLAYLMADLKWPNILEKAVEVINRGDDVEAKFYFSPLIQAYGKRADWDYAELFRRYS